MCKLLSLDGETTEFTWDGNVFKGERYIAQEIKKMMQLDSNGYPWKVNWRIGRVTGTGTFSTLASIKRFCAEHHINFAFAYNIKTHERWQFDPGSAAPSMETAS